MNVFGFWQVKPGARVVGRWEQVSGESEEHFVLGWFVLKGYLLFPIVIVPGMDPEIRIRGSREEGRVF